MAFCSILCYNLISCEEVTDLQKESDMSDRALTVKKVKHGYMTPLKRVQQGSVLQDTEDAWGDSYKELNGLEVNWVLEGWMRIKL